MPVRRTAALVPLCQEFAMAPRAYWKGYLRLSLVSCPIALYPASSGAERVSFNRINKKTGNRLKQLLVDSETGDPVEREDIGRGYEVDKGQYVLVEDDELEKIKIESTHTIDIDSFVPRAEIDDRYMDSPYYIAPTDKVGQEAFAVIRDVIREKKMVALARVVLSRREHVIMLEAFENGLLGTTLRYAYEVREAKGYFEDVPDLKLPKEMQDLAAHIVDSKAAHFDPATFEDHDETALVELLRAKQAGRVIQQPKEEATPARVVNLMDALRASIGAETKKKPAAASTRSRAAAGDRKSTRLNSSHLGISYAVFCLKKKIDMGECVDRRWTDVRIGSEFLALAFDAQAARIVAPELEAFVRHRRHLAGEYALLLRVDCVREWACGDLVDLRPSDLVLQREVFRRVAHVHAGRRVEQRLPQEILELDLAHPKSATMGVGGDRIAAHGFRADAEREI